MILKSLAAIMAGHPFRGKIKEDLNGNGLVIQIKDLPSAGDKLNWQRLLKTNVASRTKVNWLKTGDVIVPSRGKNIFATSIQSEPSNLVVSPHFFIIRLQSQLVLPEFIAWQINQSQIQQYLKKSAEGSLQVSIRKSVFENMELTVPPKDIQYKLIEMNALVLKEQKLFEALIANRKSEITQVSNNILSQYKDHQ
ncbi:restriction endonuclease subunit S [Aliiglaciecola sp.]|nr:restriction endonuclease subunit S [Aliiglaciecola sp.]